MTEHDLDRRLDGALEAAAPRLARRSPQLHADLVDLARESARPRRASLRLVAVGGAAAVVLGGGGLAAAAGVLPGAEDLRTTATVRVADCAIGFDVVPASGAGGGSGRAVEAARAFLDDYDYDYAGIDRRRAVADLGSREGETRSLQEVLEQEPYKSSDAIEVQAVQQVVFDDLVTHLDRRGLDPDDVRIEAANRCGSR